VYLGIAAPYGIGKPDDTPIVENGKPWDRIPPRGSPTPVRGVRSLPLTVTMSSQPETCGSTAGLRTKAPRRQRPRCPRRRSPAVELANRLGAPVTSGGQTQTNVNLGIPLTDEDRADFARRQSNLETTHDLTAGAIQNTLDEAKVQQKVSRRGPAESEGRH